MAITFVNSTALTFGTAASTWSIPPHSSKLGGSAFIVGLGLASTVVTISTVTDNTTNLYRRAVSRTASTKAAGAELWYATGISSLSTRLSVTLSGNSSGSMAVGQWSGVSTNNALLEVDSSAITANSTVHRCGEITPSSANAVVVSFSRTNASTMVPTAHDGSFQEWCSTAQAVRSVGGYIIQTVPTTAGGQWRTNAAGTSGGCQHTGVIAAFSDTQVILPGGLADAFALVGCV